MGHHNGCEDSCLGAGTVLAALLSYPTSLLWQSGYHCVYSSFQSKQEMLPHCNSLLWLLPQHQPCLSACCLPPLCSQAINYAASNGLDKESLWPYTGVNGNCSMSQIASSTSRNAVRLSTTISPYYGGQIATNSESALKTVGGSEPRAGVQAQGCRSCVGAVLGRALMGHSPAPQTLDETL